MKNKKYLFISLIAVFLVAGLITSSNLSTSAAQNKILVTDSDDSGTISAGDEFCIGSECFNVVNNEDGGVRALAKYNLYVGSNYNKIVLDINMTYIQCVLMASDRWDCEGEAKYFFEGEQVGGYDEWVAKIIEKYDIDDVAYGDWFYFNAASEIEGEVYNEGLGTYRNLTYKFYPLETITETTEGFARQNELARGVTGDKGNANYPIYATVRFEPFTTFGNYWIYKKGYVNVELQDRDENEVLNYLNTYRDNLEVDSGYEVLDVGMLNMSDLDHMVYDITGSELPLTEWYNASTGQDQEDEHGTYGELGDLKSILSDKQSWLWNTSFWLMTLASDAETVDGFSYNSNPVTYFVSSAGDICYTDSCNTAIPRAGIRPTITIASDQFELNRLDINGTVRWIDDNDSSKIRPKKSTIRLYRNGSMINSVEVEKDDEEDLWRFSFRNLLKYDTDRNLYRYSITQDNVAQYASNINSFDVVNRYAPDATNPSTSDINPIYYVCAAATAGAVIFVAVRKGRR